MDIEPILQELKRRLQDLYGERLKGLYLFGSYARGEQRAGSDLDVAVILDDYRSAGEEIEVFGGVGAELSLKYGTLVAITLVRDYEWRNGEEPFLINARREAAPV